MAQNAQNVPSGSELNTKTESAPSDTPTQAMSIKTSSVQNVTPSKTATKDSSITSLKKSESAVKNLRMSKDAIEKGKERDSRISFRKSSVTMTKKSSLANQIPGANEISMSLISFPKSSSRLIDEKKKMNLSDKKKQALGSVIDIRRSSVTRDSIERKAARYMNTYKLESENPFSHEKVEKILESVLTDTFKSLNTYDPKTCMQKAKSASLIIRDKVKELEFDRYKIVSSVSIGERNQQGLLASCSFLWDIERDGYAVFSIETTYLYGLAHCFGLYYE